VEITQFLLYFYNKILYSFYLIFLMMKKDLLFFFFEK